MSAIVFYAESNPRDEKNYPDKRNSCLCCSALSVKKAVAIAPEL
ncbi:hypothetical protein [Phormidium sp. CCY1219]|nr:hypothetical protein [Phormidium sp. CCY1219]